MILEELKEETIKVKKSVGLVEAQIEDNCIEHGVRGILHHADIEKMIAMYQDEDKQARVFGKFQHLTGLVYKKFTRRVHVIKPFPINPVDWCVVEFLDTHPRNPDAVMWVAVNAKGERIIIDEIYDNLATGELSMKIKQKADRFRIIERCLEPAAFIEDQHTRKSLQKDLAINGLTYSPASKERSQGTRLVKDALEYQEVNGEFMVKPMLYVFETCVRTIWEFEHWKYNEYTGKASEKHNPSEKPEDKNDHMMENIGRVLLNNTGFVPMPQLSFGYGSTIDGSTPTTDPY